MKLFYPLPFLSICFLWLPPGLAAQKDTTHADTAVWFPDFLGHSEDCWAMKEGFVLWPGMEVPEMENEYWPCKMQPKEKVVPEGYVYLAFHVEGMDCHSTFDYSWRLNPELSEFEYRVIVTYKGCRAGGSHFIRLVKLPINPGWHVKLTYQHKDNIHHQLGSNEVFFYPPDR